MENKIDLILSEMKNLNQKITELESNMATKDSLSNISTQLDNVAEQVAATSEKITDIKDNQKAIADVINQMSAVQERQEQTFNLLARRSIDQEAELKRIK